MPANRNALIRYRTIDNCLRNRFKRWTLEDLIEACSEALYEYEGIDKGVSKRTVQLDIQLMRSDKLGYNAPIVVEERKYYTYSDPDYSITNIPLTDQDLDKLNEVVKILQQFKCFSHFQELNGMVQRLEDKIQSSKSNQHNIIDFEKNENLKGLEFIDPIYQAILNQKTLYLTYQSFKARQASTFNFFPYLLKEYRNRWFVIGRKKNSQPVQNLALDRIQKLEISDVPYKGDPTITPDFYKDVVGVSVSQNQAPEEIQLFIDNANAPYVLTKPIHPSQKIINRNHQGVTISLRVQPNFELEREILGFGQRVKVLKPRNLKNRIHNIIHKMMDQYEMEVKISELNTSIKKVQSRGYSIMKSIYRKRELQNIFKLIHTYGTKESENFRRDENLFAVRSLMKEMPELMPLLFNDNLKQLVKGFGEKYFLSKAIYFDKPPKSNWYVTWHQDCTINVSAEQEKKTDFEELGFKSWTNKGEFMAVRPPVNILQNTFTVRIHLDDTTEENGALKVIPQSHYDFLSTEEIKEFRENRNYHICEVERGGLQLMKPLTLHASGKTTNDSHRRVIHLEFNNLELPEGMTWHEKESI